MRHEFNAGASSLFWALQKLAGSRQDGCSEETNRVIGANGGLANAVKAGVVAQVIDITVLPPEYLPPPQETLDRYAEVLKRKHPSLEFVRGRQGRVEMGFASYVAVLAKPNATVPVFERM